MTLKGWLWIGTFAFLFSMLGGCGATNPSMDTDGYQTMSCVNLAPGQTQLVNLPTMPPARYYLSRLPDEGGRPVYHVRIPVQFRTPHNTAESPLGDEMLARANACLAGVASILNGPGGEKLSVELATTVTGEIGPFQIEIWTTPVRGHSQLWSAYWQCPDITHEVFHLMGEVDEYQEVILKADDCRELGPADSLMSAPASAFDAASPTVEFVQCRCDGADGGACPPAAGTLDHCPAGTQEQIVNRLPEWKVLGSPQNTQWVSEDPQHRFLRRGAPVRPSLLYPAEFAMVVSPACQDNNPVVKTFYQCAANAYLSASTGQGCLNNMPAECSGGNTRWITAGATDPQSFLPASSPPAAPLTPMTPPGDLTADP